MNNKEIRLDVNNSPTDDQSAWGLLQNSPLDDNSKLYLVKDILNNYDNILRYLISNKVNKDVVSNLSSQLTDGLNGKVNKSDYTNDLNNVYSGISQAKDNAINTSEQFVKDNYLDKVHTINTSAGPLNDGDDLNNYTNEGMYSILNAQNIKNAPNSNYNWSRLLVFEVGGIGVYQMFFTGNNETYLRTLSGVPSSWNAWTPYAGNSVVNVTDTQTISGQKTFSQYPLTSSGDTIYPASSTGWMSTGLSIGKNITGARYSWRVDTINHNPVAYFTGQFDCNSSFGHGAWGSEDNKIFSFPAPYEIMFERFFYYYIGYPQYAYNALRTFYADNSVGLDALDTSNLDTTKGIEFSHIFPLKTVLS